METTFNLNQFIKVLLTDKGRKIHRDEHYKFYSGYNIPYKPRVVDEDGWSHWQAWDFIQTFGSHFELGNEVCCEMDIKFITK